MAEESTPGATSRSAMLRELVGVLTFALLLALLIRAFVMQVVVVDGPSMEPTLYSGQRLIINKLVYHFRSPSTGDIIVFGYPRDPSRDFVKRVIAAGGQTVEIRAGVVYVNDERVNETYITYPSHDNFPRIRIPAGTLFVLGDNRSNSDDSRSDVGMVPLGNVQGMAFLRFWPLPEFGPMGR